MIYKEAIKEAKIQIDAYENMISYCKYFEPKEDISKYEYKIEFLKTAIEALDKQIPKKPMAIKIPTKWGGHDYRCPVCATRVFEQSYCMSCGQAIDCSDIDWSDSE